MAEAMQTDAVAGPSTSRKKGDPLVEKKDAPWVEKYRPKTLDDVAAHKEIIDTSRSLVSVCLPVHSAPWHPTPCPSQPASHDAILQRLRISSNRGPLHSKLQRHILPLSLQPGGLWKATHKVGRCVFCPAVRKLTKEDRLPHLLLYGPPGTGKTSTVLAVARQMYGSAMQNMTLELNASDDRGIDVVREQVQDFASTRSVFW